MQRLPQKSEIPGQNISPARLLEELDSLNTEEQKFVYLRNIFIEETDVDEYIRYLKSLNNTGLSNSQVTTLKCDLRSFKVYLRDYLERTGRSIEKFSDRFKKNIADLANKGLTPQEVEKLAYTRMSFAQAMNALSAPRGLKGKNLQDAARQVIISGPAPNKELSADQIEYVISRVRIRFESNMKRHEGISWNDVQIRLDANPEKLWSLYRMEKTGGVPDVVGYDKNTNKYLFFDCSEESPYGRRNICYDRAGEELAQKAGYRTFGNAVDIAAEIGIEILTEAEYKMLMSMGRFDRSTQSWRKREPEYIVPPSEVLDGVYVDSMRGESMRSESMNCEDTGDDGVRKEKYICDSSRGESLRYGSVRPEDYPSSGVVIVTHVSSGTRFNKWSFRGKLEV